MAEIVEKILVIKINSESHGDGNELLNYAVCFKTDHTDTFIYAGKTSLNGLTRTIDNYVKNHGWFNKDSSVLFAPSVVAEAVDKVKKHNKFLNLVSRLENSPPDYEI